MERSGRRAEARRSDVAGEQDLDAGGYTRATCPVAPAGITEGWNDAFQLAQARRSVDLRTLEVGARSAMSCRADKVHRAARQRGNWFARGCYRSALFKRSATSLRVERSGARSADGSSPRSLGASPRLSQSEGPCGPSERDVGARAEAGGLSRRATPTRRVRSRRLRRGGSRWAERGPRRAGIRRAARARQRSAAGADVPRAPRSCGRLAAQGRRRRGRWITARSGLRRSACRGADAPSAATAHRGGGQQGS